MSETKKTEKLDFFSRMEMFYEKNKKMITIGGSVALVVVLAAVAFWGLYLPSQNKEAQEQVIGAQQYFERDSFTLALNGDGNYDGFLTIIDDYGMTKTGNLSKYRAGICYLRLGDYDKAIDFLEKFNGSEPITTAAAYSLLGDAYSEKNNVDEAISYYKKAADQLDDDYLAPMYLLKTGLYLKLQGKKDEALKYFQMIKDKHPNSSEAQEVEKYIAMVS